MREDSSIFKSLHAASIVIWEIILHLPKKKKRYDADQKEKKNIPFTYSIILSSNLSVYCSKLLKVMLEIHTVKVLLSKLCCLFFYPHQRTRYIYKNLSIYIYIYI